MRGRFCPECRWTVVTDGRGGRRLEMRWVPMTAEGSSPAAPLARAA